MNKRQRKKQQVRKELAKKQTENITTSKSNKKKRLIAALELIVGICTIAGVIIQFMDIKIPLRFKPKADIMAGVINVEYLQELREDGHEVYLLFQDTINEKRKTTFEDMEGSIDVGYLQELRKVGYEAYPLFQDIINEKRKSVFEGNCATQVFVSNDYDNEILLDKIMFEAQNIEVNTRPVLIFTTSFASFTEMDLYIYNSGWGDANNISVQFEDLEGDINEYLKPDKQSVEVPLVKYGDKTNFKLWDNTEFLKDGFYRIRASFKDKDGDIESNSDDLYVKVKDGRFLREKEKYEGASRRIYGINIDTSEKSYKKEEVISETIKANERLELPICFSADKSCELNFRIGFEVIKKNNKKETVWTEWAVLELKISSLGDDFENVEDYSRVELLKKAEFDKAMVTYPYIKRCSEAYGADILK